MPRYKIILNPTSGRGLGEKSYPLIERELIKNGLEFEIERTASAGDAMQLAQQAADDNFDVVVAAGGDGTFNEVLNGLMRVGSHRDQRPALSVLPIGRGNDFCFGADIPASVAAVCHLLAGGECRQIDVGFVKGGDFPDGRYFGNCVGIGQGRHVDGSAISDNASCPWKWQYKTIPAAEDFSSLGTVSQRNDWTTGFLG